MVINASLQEGDVPQHFKEVVICPLLKKPLLDSTLLDNFQPVSNLPFWGKVVEKVVCISSRGSWMKSSLFPVRAQDSIWDKNSIGHTF